MTPLIRIAKRYRWKIFPCHSVEDGRCSCGRAACGLSDCRDPAHCHSAGKHPRTEHGFKDATMDITFIRRWVKEWPDANRAIATGADSGLVVLDVDPDKGGDESLAVLENAHDWLPPTIEVITGGGGRHVYLSHPGIEIRNSAGELGPGLDVRGDGGYVLAPPSTHIS